MRSCKKTEALLSREESPHRQLANANALAVTARPRRAWQPFRFPQSAADRAKALKSAAQQRNGVRSMVVMTVVGKVAHPENLYGGRGWRCLAAAALRIAAKPAAVADATLSGRRSACSAVTRSPRRNATAATTASLHPVDAARSGCSESSRSHSATS